jgi:hypothetical protein
MQIEIQAADGERAIESDAAHARAPQPLHVMLD